MNSHPSEIKNHIYDKLIPVIQSDFPIVNRPFKVIAERIGISEREVIDSILSMMNEGIIRIFGPVFDARKLGYVSTLVAARVDKNSVNECAVAMLDINEITHNYLRDNEFNLWFTITALNSDIMDSIIKLIDTFHGVKKVLTLPVRKVFKINAVWKTGKSETKKIDYEAEVPPLDKTGKIIVRALQNQFPVFENPFRVIADTTGINESTIIETINSWLSSGTIRRFGARLNHKKIGFTCNILAAWSGKDLERWGNKFAESPDISHCYLRKSYEEWPYELYTMGHARSEAEANDKLKSMREFAQDSDMVALKTLQELKKTSMKYFLED